MKKLSLTVLSLVLTNIVFADEFDDKISYIEKNYGSLSQFASGTGDEEVNSILHDAIGKHKDGHMNESLSRINYFISILDYNRKNNEGGEK